MSAEILPSMQSVNIHLWNVVISCTYKKWYFLSSLTRKTSLFNSSFYLIYTAFLFIYLWLVAGESVTKKELYKDNLEDSEIYIIAPDKALF